MQDHPELQLLAAEELPQVAAIEAQVFPEPLDLRSLARLYASPQVRYVVLRDEGKVAAYFGFDVHGPTAHVISNATHPDCRRRGYGGRVLHEAEPLARSLGARWFLGEVRVSNDAQRRLLAEIHWQEIGVCRRFFGNGEDAYVVFRCFPEEVGP